MIIIIRTFAGFEEILAEEVFQISGLKPEIGKRAVYLKGGIEVVYKLNLWSRLAMRTNLFGTVYRIIHHMSFAIHKYFKYNEILYVNTPIITVTDAEGAGETFRVTTLPLVVKDIGLKNDFLRKPTH